MAKTNNNEAWMVETTESASAPEAPASVMAANNSAQKVARSSREKMSWICSMLIPLFCVLGLIFNACISTQENLVASYLTLLSLSGFFYVFVAGIVYFCIRKMPALIVALVLNIVSTISSLVAVVNGLGLMSVILLLMNFAIFVAGIGAIMLERKIVPGEDTAYRRIYPGVVFRTVFSVVCGLVVFAVASVTLVTNVVDFSVNLFTGGSGNDSQVAFESAPKKTVEYIEMKYGFTPEIIGVQRRYDNANEFSIGIIGVTVTARYQDKEFSVVASRQGRELINFRDNYQEDELRTAILVELAGIFPILEGQEPVYYSFSQFFGTKYTGNNLLEIVEDGSAPHLNVTYAYAGADIDVDMFADFSEKIEDSVLAGLYSRSAITIINYYSSEMQESVNDISAELNDAYAPTFLGKDATELREELQQKQLRLREVVKEAYSFWWNGNIFVYPDTLSYTEN